MNIYNTIIVLCWVAFIVVWMIKSLSAKRNVRSNRVKIALVVRLVAVLVIIVFVKIEPADYFAVTSTVTSPLLGAIGVIFTVLGIGLAIWARVYLGRNWGMPMSLKENPELVTTGPYAYVRNPIYSGMLLAIIGSIFASSLFWLGILVFAGIYFIYSSKVEEGIMLREFPETYPAYKARTKMLIPFIL